ncbi:hypothetical protein Lal_00033594 [Lupinus albus]|nr:hypothetical protein Lal_00033594 [Lupinus albus]
MMLELNEARTKRTEDLLAAITLKLGVNPSEGTNENGEEVDSDREAQTHDRWRRLEIPIFMGEDAYGWIQKLESYFTMRARDPKVGGGVGRIREVAKNRTPILTKVNRRMKYARSGALGALDFGFTIYVFRILNDYLRI